MNTQTESPTRLHGRWLLIARLAWLLFTLTCILSALSFVFIALSWATPVPDTWGFRGDAMLLALAFGSIGLLLARRYPHHPIGWLLLLAGLINSILELCVEYATYALLTKSGALPYGTLAAWTASWIWVAAIGMLIYSFLLFPTGHLPSERWRPVAWFFVGMFGLMTFVFMIRPGPLYFAPYLDNPFAVQVAYRVLSPIPVAIAAAVLLVGISVILRLRRAEGVERQQLKWFAYAVTLRVIFGMSESVAEALGLKGTDPKFYQYLSVAIWIAIAVAIAFAILRYRLWDIDIIINRTLVYFTLIAIITGLYVLVVGSLSSILQNQNDLAAPLVALLIVAALVEPLRRALQLIVNRLLRFDPGRRDESQIALQTSSEQSDEAQEENVQIHVITEVDSSPHTRLHGRWLIIARLAWIAIAILATIIYVAAAPVTFNLLRTPCYVAPCDTPFQTPSEGASALEEEASLRGAWYHTILEAASRLVSLGVALLIFWRRSQDWMAQLTAIMLVTISAFFSPSPLMLTAAQPLWHLPRALLWAIGLGSTVGFLYLFPDGRFVPRWTRGLAIALLVGTGILAAAGAPFQSGLPVFVIALATGAVFQVYRYRRVSNPLQRQQTKWVVLGISGMVVPMLVFILFVYLNPSLNPLQSTEPISPQGVALFSLMITVCIVIPLCFLPVTLAFSLLRYRLWDVDIFINRTLVYGALTASVVGLYVLIVGGLSIGLQTQNNLPGIIAILVIAFLFQPLRRRLREIADRFVPVQQSVSPLEQRKDMIAIQEGVADTTLRGWWLLIARLVWAAGFTVFTVMYALGFLAVREALSTVCEEELCTLRQQIRHTDAGEQVVPWPGPPIGFADRLRSDQVKALETLGLTFDGYGWLAALQMGIPALVYLLIAARLFWWRSDNWMVLFVSITVATFPLQNMPLPFTLGVRQPAWEWVVDLGTLVALLGFLILPLIFPNGRFVPRWTRWVVLFELAGTVTVTLFRNSFMEIPGATDFIAVFIAASFGTGVYAQVHRYFRVASPVERQQIKWVVVGLTGFIFTTFLALQPLNELLTSRAANMDPARALILSSILDTLFQAISLFIPVSIAISVLRYRLWDVDILINRTLVYGSLTGVVVSAFVIIVGLLSILFQSSGNSIIAIVATGLIALLFNPLRQRLQRGINRLMYGERDEPYTALSRLGRRLEASLAPEAVLPTVVTTVRDVLKLPYVAIYLQQDSHGYKIVAESASPLLRIENGKIRVPGMEREGRCIPLIHQGETVGYIVLGPRAPNEAFNATDLRLLEDLAPQVGVAVHAVRLTADLQHSRERLVLAREEERRRLRRDLHDGLGPQLAGLALKLETLRNRLNGDPLADSLLADLAKRTQDATADIRHLVYELRPPALDELGLVSALREGAAQYSQQGVNGVQITFDAPESLLPLPAAVEVAVYRIAQEALTNVIRHADARNCFIRLTVDESAGLLCLEVQDDGKGLPTKRRTGVGLNSMRERAEELGGTLTLTSLSTGGTLLTARLPCRIDDRNTSKASTKEL
jgi:signal transduction histidine kinase